MKPTKEQINHIVNHVVENHQPSLKVWKLLCEQKKCLWCSKKYLKGIIPKAPYEHSKSFMERFDPEFLFHADTTHGYTPEMIKMFVETWINNEI